MKILINVLLIVILMSCLSACGQSIPPPIQLELVADGFTSPVALIDPGDGSARLFVVDQIGLIWIISNGDRIERPFLDIRENVIELNDFYDERGLLGLAFHPEFANNGLFYVSYSAPLQNMSLEVWDHETHISEFRIRADDPNQADANSERNVMTIYKPGYNYEGGHIAFGPDGYLYIATGDSVRDPAAEAGKYAQDPFYWLGKILRIDVNGVELPVRNYRIPHDNPFLDGSGIAEVYAYGFRNPYRFSFDVTEEGETRLFVADVGQSLMEEVNLVEAGGNYGWPTREGTLCFNSQRWDQPLASCSTTGLSDPIIAYPHIGDRSAIIGGFIYRGTAIPDLQGGYVFGDWGRGNGHLFVARPRLFNQDVWNITEIPVDVDQLLGLGQDESGELYLLTKAAGIGATGETGAVYKIVPAR